MNRGIQVFAVAVALGLTAVRPALAQQGAAPSYRHEVPATLLAEAKVSEDSARGLALARIPHGTVKSLELEREHSRLIWSFEVTVPGQAGITEVNVDALTGEVAGLEHEDQ